MEFYVCEFNVRVSLPHSSEVIEFAVATPVPEDKEVSVYNGIINVKQPYHIGMPSKVLVSLSKWLPKKCSVSIETRRLPYPSFCTCAPDIQSIVRNCVQILLTHLILLTYESTKSSLNQ